MTNEPISSGLLGRELLIRTVTMTLTGKVTAIDHELIELEDAAWIADTGRFSAALVTGRMAEIEPFPSTTWVQRSSVVDMTIWAHALPRETL